MKEETCLTRTLLACIVWLGQDTFLHDKVVLLMVLPLPLQVAKLYANEQGEAIIV